MKTNNLKNDSITPELTENLKSSLSKFKSLSNAEKSSLLGGVDLSFSDNGVGEDTLPNSGD